MVDLSADNAETGGNEIEEVAESTSKRLRRPPPFFEWASNAFMPIVHNFDYCSSGVFTNNLSAVSSVFMNQIVFLSIL